MTQQTITQLNPTIPLDCPKGAGQALFMIDPGTEHHLLWVIALDVSGEIWTYANPFVRAQKNVTMGRRLDEPRANAQAPRNTPEQGVSGKSS